MYIDTVNNHIPNIIYILSARIESLNIISILDIAIQIRCSKRIHI